MSAALIALTLGGASALLPTVSSPVRPALGHSSRTRALRMESRWSDPILDESIPDPVYDSDEPYKGRVPYGFSTTAEKLNGRAAMTGFTVLFLQEFIAGKGVLETYG